MLPPLPHRRAQPSLKNNKHIWRENNHTLGQGWGQQKQLTEKITGSRRRQQEHGPLPDKVGQITSGKMVISLPRMAAPETIMRIRAITICFCMVFCRILHPDP
jgi:hypothetical protein